MRKSFIVFVFVFLVLFLCCASVAFSYDEKTHTAMNEYIALSTVTDYRGGSFSLADYLYNYLGFLSDYDQELKGKREVNIDALERVLREEKKTILGWLSYGGRAEDHPGSELQWAAGVEGRAVNHFHNPLEPWEEAGLNDYDHLGRLWTGQSSVLWSQNRNQGIGGKWSWQDAREYFYIALTGSDFTNTEVAKTEEQRQEYFANTFRAVGHMMHLVQDSSVPEHVRNDIHVSEMDRLLKPKYYAYEDEIENFRKENPTQWEQWMNSPRIFDKSILDIAIPAQYADDNNNPPDAPVAISRIIDTDQYDKLNPVADVTVGLNIGLSEYANANFLSYDTIPRDYPNLPERHRFPHPSLDWEDWANGIYSLWRDPINQRLYIQKSGEGETINHLAIASLFTYHLDATGTGILDLDENWVVSMDPRCYEEYASKLVPRAAGYSAGLLEYFFRGTLEITAPTEYVYSIVDGKIDQDKAQQEFTKIKARVKNVTPRVKDNDGNVLSHEEIGQGKLIAVAKYKKRKNYQADLSGDPPTSASREAVFSYSVSVAEELTSAQIDSLNNQQAVEIVFDFSNNRIPVGITDLYLQVVFKGTLGNEQDTAIAVGMKDLNEPQHLAFWNNTDYFLLYGEPRKAEDIEDDPDVDDYGYIYPHSFTEEICFGSTSGHLDSAPVVVSMENLSPARYSRIIVLVDDKDGYLVKDHLTSPSPTNDDLTWIYSFPGVVNQEDDRGVWETTDVYSIRGIRQHQMTYFIRVFPSLVYDPYAFPAPAENNLGPHSAIVNFP